MSQSQTLSLAAGILPEHNGVVVAQAAVEAGYSHFGITVDEAWTAADTRAVKQLQRDNDLSCLDVEVVWLDPGAAVTDLHHKIIDVGAELGAANVLIVSSEAEPARVAAAQHQLCELCSDSGMRVVLEFLRITAITRPSQALEIARLADHSAAGVLVDSLHLARSGESSEVLAGSAALLPYVQLCDAPAHFSEDRAGLLEDALDRRSAPGEGELPLEDTLALNPGCPLSLEVRSKRYREDYPDPASRARAIRLRTEEFLQSRTA
ncbi:MAG: sugar phosphate isomerase/epimerase family protein [Pseudomonadales bacterium]